LMVLKEGFDFRSKVGVATARFIQVCGLLDVLKSKCAVQYLFHMLPPFRIHALGPREISRCNHARAEVHSRDTVAGETPSTWEVSSIESPPKKRNSMIRLCWGSRSARFFKASSSIITSRLIGWGACRPPSGVTLQTC